MHTISSAIKSYRWNNISKWSAEKAVLYFSALDTIKRAPKIAIRQPLNADQSEAVCIFLSSSLIKGTHTVLIINVKHDTGITRPRVAKLRATNMQKAANRWERRPSHQDLSKRCLIFWSSPALALYFLFTPLCINCSPRTKKIEARDAATIPSGHFKITCDAVVCGSGKLGFAIWIAFARFLISNTAKIALSPKLCLVEWVARFLRDTL